MPKHRKRHHRSHSRESEDSDKEKRKMQIIEMERRLNAIEQASKHRPPLQEPAALDDRQFSEERSVADSSLDSTGDILQLHAGDDQADQLEEGEKENVRPEQENELSDDILNILGEDISKEKKHHPDFQKDVAGQEFLKPVSMKTTEN